MTLLKQQPADEHDELDASRLWCAVCHHPLAQIKGEVLSTYWTIMHDGEVTRLCSGCHTPDDGGVCVVIPATKEDRWVSFMSA